MLDEISWYIMFRQAGLKGILEKIRKFCMFSLRCQLYEKWKRGIAMLSGIALTGVLISISQYVHLEIVIFVISIAMLIQIAGRCVDTTIDEYVMN